MGLAAAPVGLGLQGAAFFEALADPAHGGHAVAEAGRDLGRALALVVKLDDALAEGDGNGFHGQSLPPPALQATFFMELL